MSEIAANKEHHSAGIALQPWHYIVFVVLGVCAIKPGLILPMIGMGVAAYVAWSMAEKKRVARENAARLSAVVNLCAPVLVPSMWINEGINSVAERAAQMKQDLIDSGNPYANIIPVIAYPYTPMLFQIGQLSMSWAIYQRMVGEQIHMENLKWYEGKDCPPQLKAIFASQVMPAPKIETV